MHPEKSRGMAGSVRHTTQSHPAYEPEKQGVARVWVLVTACLLLTALASVFVRSACRPDVPGATESGFGVRHEQRGTQWYHCEPWIRHALSD